MAGLAELSDLLAAEHLQPLGHCPASEDGHTLVLIGPDEPAFWPHFMQSPEYRDTRPNPLDRWSERVIRGIAAAIGGEPLFPFGGPPYQPFYTWALDTGRFWQSPIGFLVHDTAGLFVSFRGAIRLPETLPRAAEHKPCDTCPNQPCKTACPVGAFDDGYDVTACKTHIASAKGIDCMAQGCRARRACPIGQGNRLPDQAAFHMKAFL